MSRIVDAVGSIKVTSGESNLTVALFAPGATFPAPQTHSVDRVMEALIDGLVDLDQRVLVYAPASSRVRGELIPVGADPILLGSDPKCVALRQSQRMALEKILLSKDCIDLVHAHSIDIPGVLFSTGFLTDIPIPNVTTLHTAIDDRILPYLSKCKNNIVACSASQQRACPSLNIKAVVHHGLVSSRYPFISEPDNYVCFVGRLDPAKQPHQAIMLAIACDMRIKLAGNIGGLASREYFDSSVRPLLRHPLVEYFGEVGFEDKVAIIGHARCNLHPTGFDEPFGLSVIEAGFCGTPTLAISRGSLGEIIENGKTGILVEDFASGLTKLGKCFSLSRRETSERSRSRFDFLCMAANYIDAYQQILNRDLGFRTMKRR